MDLKELQERSYIAIQKHCDQKDEVLNWAIGLSEEVGEVLSHFKHAFWGGEPLNLQEVGKEIGDVLWYSAAICTVLGLDLDTVAQLNVEKLSHRFGHSTEFSNEQSKDRHNSEQKFSETDTFKKLLENLLLKDPPKISTPTGEREF